MVKPKKSAKNSNFSEALHRFKSYSLSIVGVVIIFLVTMIAIFADFIAPQGPEFIDLEMVRQPPGN